MFDIVMNNKRKHLERVFLSTLDIVYVKFRPTLVDKKASYILIGFDTGKELELTFYDIKLYENAQLKLANTLEVLMEIH